VGPGWALGPDCELLNPHRRTRPSKTRQTGHRPWGTTASHDPSDVRNPPQHLPRVYLQVAASAGTGLGVGCVVQRTPLVCTLLFSIA
jgi:hypothetical protein